MNSIVDPVSDSGEFYVGRIDIGCIMSHFGNDFLFTASMRDHNISQNKLLTYLWYLNLGYTFRGLEVIQKFNNDNNND